MAELFTFTGLDAMRQRLQEIGAQMIPLAGIALQQEADAILEVSQTLVPVDTGALRASGEVLDVEIHGSRVQSGVRYGGDGPGFERTPREYAYWVHNIPRPHRVGQDHFLSQPLFAATAGMLARIAEQLRNAL